MQMSKPCGFFNFFFLSFFCQQMCYSTAVPITIDELKERKKKKKIAQRESSGKKEGNAQHFKKTEWGNRCRDSINPATENKKSTLSHSTYNIDLYCLIYNA